MQNKSRHSKHRKHRIFRNLAAMLPVMLAVLLLTQMLILTGCGGNGNETGGETKPMDKDALAQELLSEITFKDQMSEVDSSVFYMLYGFTEEDVDSVVMISSTGATAEEIVIMHAASADKAEALLAAAAQRVADQRDSFENYVPAEMDKLEAPVIQQIEDYVILCISDDNAKAEEIIGRYQ